MIDPVVALLLELSSFCVLIWSGKQSKVRILFLAQTKAYSMTFFSSLIFPGQ